MKDYKGHITIDGTEYDLVFDLNVLEEIQNKYGSLTAWGDLTTAGDDGMNAGAIKFGITLMLNEGIDIKNEDEGTDIPFVTEKWVGRKLMSVGIDQMAASLNEAVINASVQADDQKNA